MNPAAIDFKLSRSKTHSHERENPHDEKNIFETFGSQDMGCYHDKDKDHPDDKHKMHQIALVKLMVQAGAKTFGITIIPLRISHQPLRRRPHQDR